jgi:hypothetical protein
MFWLSKVNIAQIAKIRPIWGRCYDHNFLQFLPMFGEIICVFLKNQCYDHNFCKKLAVVWAKNADIFAKFFGETIFKIVTSVPGRPVRTSCVCIASCLWWLIPCTNKRFQVCAKPLIWKRQTVSRFSCLPKISQNGEEEKYFRAENRFGAIVWDFFSGWDENI